MPIGVRVEPTFAAIVCKDRTLIKRSCLFTFIKAAIAIGIKIINETSLVISIEMKKLIKIKNLDSDHAFLDIEHSFI